MSRRTEYLLYPEWQGYGVDTAVHDGAFVLARSVYPGAAFTAVPVPVDELLTVRDGVLGLDSIAGRFRSCLEALRASAPDVVITIGGTCGVEAAPIAYLNERYEGDLAVVWFDAHGDLNTPETSPSGHFHGMVLRTLAGDGPAAYVGELRRPLKARQIFLAGTRELDPDESAYVRDAGVSVTAADALADPQALPGAIAARGFGNVYLHVDVDCFRPEEIGDSLMRTAGGPTFSAVASTLAALRAAFHVAGSSIVEFVDRGDGSTAKLRELIAVR